GIRGCGCCLRGQAGGAPGSQDHQGCRVSRCRHRRPPVHIGPQDFCSVPTITMGEVGRAEPASGSTVIAAALTVPFDGTRICSTLAWPSGSGLKVTEGTGFPSWMNQSWYAWPDGTALS